MAYKPTVGLHNAFTPVFRATQDHTIHLRLPRDDENIPDEALRYLDHSREETAAIAPELLCFAQLSYTDPERGDMYFSECCIVNAEGENIALPYKTRQLIEKTITKEGQVEPHGETMVESLNMQGRPDAEQFWIHTPDEEEVETIEAIHPHPFRLKREDGKSINPARTPDRFEKESLSLMSEHIHDALNGYARMLDHQEAMREGGEDTVKYTTEELKNRNAPNNPFLDPNGYNQPRCFSTKTPRHLPRDRREPSNWIR